MSIGLLALLDDIAALVKVGAASLDDIPAQVAKTSGKVSGIVIDDAAVTPKYVVGLDPARELSIIAQITKRSLLNKIVFLGPVTLLLGVFLPSFIQPLLMVGGGYLCFEGYEKIHSLFVRYKAKADMSKTEAAIITADELEKMRVKSAVRTDFILSAEIMAIAYATVTNENLVTQITVMMCVAIFITLAVYGFVAIIVKADDFGLSLATKEKYAFLQGLGRGIVKFMPFFLQILGYVGTAAMLWVGADIIVHNVYFLNVQLESLHEFFKKFAVLAWLVKVLSLAVTGFVFGFIIDIVIKYIIIIYRLMSQKTLKP